MENFQERTEEPTAKRLLAAKKSGHVPFSEELFKSSSLLAALLLLWAFSSSLCKKFEHLFSFQHLNSSSPLEALQDLITPFIFPTVALMLLFFLLHFALHFLQRGFLVVTEKKEFPPMKKNKLFTAIFFLIKGTFLGGALIIFLTTASFHFFALFYFALFTLLALFVLGISDFFFETLAWKKTVRMTRQEVLEERRENGRGRK